MINMTVTNTTVEFMMAMINIFFSFNQKYFCIIEVLGIIFCLMWPSPVEYYPLLFIHIYYDIWF